MPCSDSRAMDYLDDHRTKSMMTDNANLQKRIKELEETSVTGKRLVELERRAAEFAEGQNRATVLLCKATNKLASSGVELTGDLKDWHDEHIEHDVLRLTEEMNTILMHKTHGTRALLKWFVGLDPDERNLVMSRQEFSHKISKISK